MGKYEYCGFTIAIGQICAVVYKSGWNKGIVFPTEKEAREWIDEYLEEHSTAID